MKIKLWHCPNIDLMETKGYRTQPKVPRRITANVETLKEASITLRKWVNENNLGGGNMDARCGEVRNEHGRHIATVSYNGRVWTPGTYPDCHEMTEAE